jgi:hypothetical protein
MALLSPNMAVKRNTKNSKRFPKIPSEGILPGSIHATYARCGKLNCKCARGEPHGPYYHRYYRIGDRIEKEYIPLGHLDAVRSACDRHRELQSEIRANNQRHNELMSQFKMMLKELDS